MEMPGRPSAAVPVTPIAPLGWKVLYYVYPVAVFVFFTTFMLYTNIIPHKSKPNNKTKARAVTRRPVLGLLFCLLSTYIAQVAALGARSIIFRQWLVDDPVMIGCLSCILIYGIQFTLLLEATEAISYPFHGSWYIALPFELAIGGWNLALALKGKSPGMHHFVVYILLALRCCCFVALVGWSLLDLCSRCRNASTDEERQRLLNKDGPQSSRSDDSGYGTNDQNNSSSGDRPESTWERLDREAREAMEKRFEEGGTWFTYIKEYKIMFPYIWPVDSPSLQLRAAGVAVCLLTSNALNVLIPRQTGIIMDSLSGETNDNPWVAVIIFAALRLASSHSGIELLRQWLWIPVKYYSYDALTRAAYSHIMRLSAEFHDSKSSSEMMVAFWGGRAISSAVENVLLQAVPMLLDLVAAVIYLSVTFGVYEGFIIIATGTVFLILTSSLMAKCRQAARSKESYSYREHYLRQTGLTGWQTVSAFNQIGYEENRHAEAVTTRWFLQHQVDFTWAVSIAFQTIVLTCGLLASAILAVSRIQNGLATAGQFTMLLMYWSQLTGPLQFFARLGRSVGDSFLEAEHLLDMMKQKPTIENKKGARPLKFVAGKVQFEDVCFSYDKKKEILKSVTFDVPAGQTVAFVGATGAGKSTMLKLLDRFYDVTGGSILIDGQDVRDVDLYSLRDRIGVVPQSPILFDDTIINNVRYGRLTATDEEVYEACRAACIHDKIESFTYGYKTHVGERGMKLSGGELQRIAIARAILKQPDLVLLDEATSAVDTDTEQKIQRSLKTLCQGRTTFIVAHRLSTIMNADRIVVIENGQVVEQGAHTELIHTKGRYADLWSKQVFLRPEDRKDSDVLRADSSDIDDKMSERTALPEGDHETTDTNCDEPTQGHASTSSQKNEGSKLNPVAPAFTPRKAALMEATRPGPQKHAGTEIPSQTCPQGDDGQREEGISGTSMKLQAEAREGPTPDHGANMTKDADSHEESEHSSNPAGEDDCAGVAALPAPSQCHQQAENKDELQECGASAYRRVSAPPDSDSLETKSPTGQHKATGQKALQEGTSPSVGNSSKPVRPATTDVAKAIGKTTATSTQTKDPAVTPTTSKENEPPSKMEGGSKAPSTRGTRGAKRGRAPWYRSRRGRGGPRSTSTSGAHQA